MWSMFSQDFTDFAKAFTSESAGLVDYLGHVAADVVGRGDVYAGDEVLKKATQRMPLPNELLRRLQESEATYTLPIQPEEQASFAQWLQSNPLSSRNAQRRQAAGDESPSSAQMTPNRRSTEWTDEPADETRQRLLDFNEVVLQRYVTLVGDAVGPRTSMPGSPGSPNTPDVRRRVMEPPSAVTFDHDEGGAEQRPAVQSPTSSPAKTPAAAGRVSEDDFFDRYFFRLTQLRVTEAQRRRDRSNAEEGEEEEEEGDSAGVSPLPASASRGRGGAAASSLANSSQSPSPQTTPQHHQDASRQSTDDDFVAVPLFAKRMMTAASGFVTNIDNALNNVVAAETSRCSGEGNDGRHRRGSRSEDDSANVDPADLVHFRGVDRQIVELESLVHELQETLRQERRRVQQLTATLEAHDIAVPAALLPTSEATTPAKSTKEGSPVGASPSAASQSAAAEAMQPRSTEAAAAAAAPATVQASPPLPADTEAAAEPLREPAADEKGNSVISAVSDADEEEDGEAWVNVNPSPEPAV